MGIASVNMEMETTPAVVGDTNPKVIKHGFGTVPATVLFTPLAAGTDAFVSAKTAVDVTVQGAAGTFDVHVVK